MGLTQQEVQKPWLKFALTHSCQLQREACVPTTVEKEFWHSLSRGLYDLGDTGNKELSC